MTDQELFKQAFDGLHASEDTYEEVLMKVNDDYEPRHGMTKRALALALVGVLTCGGTAYAVGSGLLASAFGSRGYEDIPATAVDDGKGGSITAPAMQFVAAGEEDVTRILGDDIQHVGLTCEAEGYTLTIDDLVVDEQGVGVATFTLVAPGGTDQFIGTYGDDYPDYGYLRYDAGPTDSQLRGVTLRGADGEIYDHYEVVDLTQTTSDELHGVMYFGAMTGGGKGGLVFGLAGTTGQEPDPSFWEVETDAFVPSSHVGSVELTDGQGHIAYVSPVGITYAAPFGEASGWLADPDETPASDGAYAHEDQGSQDEDTGWVPLNTTIQLASGDPYVVESEDVLNSYCGYYTTEGAMTLVFNRLVDPSQVTGVTVDGPDGTTLVFS